MLATGLAYASADPTGDCFWRMKAANRLRRERAIGVRSGTPILGEVAGQMAIDVLTEIEIARPRAEVAAFATDPSNAPSWYENIKAVEWRTEPPPRVGSRIAFVAQFLGRRLEYTYEIRELVPTGRLVMSTNEGRLPMETTYTWDDAPGGGTRMTLRNRGEAAGFSRLLAPLMAPAVRRANNKDLRKLKALLEGER
jgi:uncharacterized membrane protein